MRADVVVLGAGIVGVSIALHLQERGRSVVLVDRRDAGEETSYGNAGLIERASIVPYAFPRDPAKLVRYGLNRSTEAHYHLGYLPRIAPWLARYWRNSSKRGLAEATRAMLPLIELCVSEHERLIREAGLAPLLRKTGWIKGFRSKRTFDKALLEAEATKPFGIKYDVLDQAEVHAREPHLSDVIIGGIHWLDPATVPDPGAVAKGYARLFVQRGGRFVHGDARSFTVERGGFSVTTEGGRLDAAEAVVALGPWSDDVFKPLGYAIPLAVKRGYHMHYKPQGNAVLNHPVFDTDAGFVLAPMTQGVRLTTGAEFAPRDAAPTPVQVDRAEPLAREIFPLGTRVDAQPWLGARPCLPDMRPVIGPAPKHPGLWFAFGHNHHGFTLGPVTGRLLAELMTGAVPCADPYWFRADRF
ncbi:NAD(P)/FAD-dependent oxidoreductase [Salinarimonas ramus]|uniref:FAD-dependent oxidoreductase n=1 Tax=Salinarimonas ramus TaxID=690164 RepID=A0A917V247_9HYPH|nr:FAD-binding oxidoreductase [Salinarimonas ramus]GGK19545.1 FAD-dependent oxidoreductase [Salinarimonas ramus]